jgi:hypothetical protein
LQKARARSKDKDLMTLFEKEFANIEEQMKNLLKFKRKYEVLKGYIKDLEIGQFLSRID